MSYYDDFLQFKRLSKKSKKFSMTADLGKNEIVCIFTILQPNERIFIFQVSWCHLMMVLINLKVFRKNPKN